VPYRIRGAQSSLRRPEGGIADGDGLAFGDFRPVLTHLFG